LQDLKEGKIDLGIGVLDNGPTYDKAFAQSLIDDFFVCLMRKGHPLSKKPLDLDRFAAANHAMLSVTGRGAGVIDRRLAKLGRKRRVALRLSHFLAIHSAIAQTDLITAIPYRLARQLKDENLMMCDLPKEIGTLNFTVSQIWHERFHHDPARKWLRSIIKSVSDYCPTLAMD